VGLVYDPRGLSGVTTARPRVAGMLQRDTERAEEQEALQVSMIMNNQFSDN
jgi:hypothetical protein